MKEFLKKNWVLVVTFIYVLLPIDIIPDIVPLFGQTDDAVVVLMEIIRRYLEYSKQRSVDSN